MVLFNNCTYGPCVSALTHTHTLTHKREHAMSFHLGNWLGMGWVPLSAASQLCRELLSKIRWCRFNAPTSIHTTFYMYISHRCSINKAQCLCTYPDPLPSNLRGASLRISMFVRTEQRAFNHSVATRIFSFNWKPFLLLLLLIFHSFQLDTTESDIISLLFKDLRMWRCEARGAESGMEWLDVAWMSATMKSKLTQKLNGINSGHASTLNCVNARKVL